MKKSPTQLLKYTVFGFLLFTPPLFADPSLGEVSQGLMEPVELVTDLALFACYIVGIALMIGGIMQYRMHRQNPKQVPLTTPIFFEIIGLFLILLPYLAQVGSHWSLSQQSKVKIDKEALVAPTPHAGEEGAAVGKKHWWEDTNQ